MASSTSCQYCSLRCKVASSCLTRRKLVISHIACILLFMVYVLFQMFLSIIILNYYTVSSNIILFIQYYYILNIVIARFTMHYANVQHMSKEIKYFLYQFIA